MTVDSSLIKHANDPTALPTDVTSLLASLPAPEQGDDDDAE
jgi:hypothetical protein